MTGHIDINKLTYIV